MSSRSEIKKIPFVTIKRNNGEIKKLISTSDLDVGSDELASDLNVHGTTVTENMSVSNNSYINGNVYNASNMYTQGNSYVEGSFFIEGQMACDGNLQLTGSSYIQSNQHIAGNLYVTGSIFVSNSDFHYLQASSVSNVGAFNTTWTTNPGSLTWTSSSVGITHNGSAQFTFSKSGFYVVDITVLTGGSEVYAGLRLRSGSTTIAKATNYFNQRDSLPGANLLHLNSILNIKKNDVITLQGARTSGSGGAALTSSTIDGESTTTGQISIFLIRNK